MNRKAVYYLKLIFSLALLTYLITKVDFYSLYAILRDVKYFFLFCAVTLIFADIALNAYLIKVIVSMKNYDDSLIKFIEMYLVSGFWGMMLPSSMGTDVAVTYRLSRTSLSGVDSITSMIALRVFTSLPLFVLAFLGSFLTYSVLKHNATVLYIIVSCLLYFSLFALMINRNILNYILNKFVRYEHYRIVRKIIEFKKSYIQLQNHRLLPKLLTVSFVSKGASVLSVFFVALALNINTSPIYFLVFVPTVIVITMVPVSVAGIGVREASFVYLFSQVGMMPEMAFSISIITFFLILLVNMTGGVIYLKNTLKYREV